MIRCTIELIPRGDESRARTLGIVEIANDASGTPEVGNYRVVLTKTAPFKGALREAWRRGLLTGEDEHLLASQVIGHHRTQRGIYDLLYRGLRACGLEKRNPQRDPVVTEPAA